jgi:hypothetical protein
MSKSEVYQPEGMRDVEQMYQKISSVLSHDPSIHEILNDCETMEDAAFEEKCYTSGIASPRYPMPAIRRRDWVEIGYLSAMNNFNTDDAFAFIQRYF